MKKIILILLVAVLAGAGVYYYVSNQPAKVANPLPMPEYGEITVEHAAPLFADGLPADYAVVDVRTEAEAAEVTTAGLINIPVALFEDADDPCAEVMAKLPKDKKIIFACPFGPRAKDMYLNLTDPVEDLGCGMDKAGMYHLQATLKYKKDHLVVQKSKLK